VFTETLQYAHGQYTPSTVNRAGKIVGALGNALDTAFHNNVCNTDVDDSYHKRFNYSADVSNFCSDYKRDRLFDNVPGRAHSAFSSFMPESTVVESCKLKLRLLKYSKRLDQLHIMHGRFK